MKSYHIETTLAEDQKLVLENVPFKAGDRVEIVISERMEPAPLDESYPLAGSVLRYDDPTEPVASEEWEACH